MWLAGRSGELAPVLAKNCTSTYKYRAIYQLDPSSGEAANTPLSLQNRRSSSPVSSALTPVTNRCASSALVLVQNSRSPPGKVSSSPVSNTTHVELTPGNEASTPPPASTSTSGRNGAGTAGRIPVSPPETTGPLVSHAGGRLPRAAPSPSLPDQAKAARAARIERYTSLPADRAPAACPHVLFRASP